MWLIPSILSLGLLAATPEPTTPKLDELLPGLFVAEGIVEFDAKIAIDCHHPATPDVYLEMLITAPDSREHESLLVAEVKPSSLHAALLAAGFEPGEPLRTDPDAKKLIAPIGDQLQVQIISAENEPIQIESWVMHVETSRPLTESDTWNGLVFAGSRLDDQGYAADLDGTLVALTPFSTEVIAPAWTTSPDAATEEPIWIADRDRVPKQGHPVRVRIVGSSGGEPEVDPDPQPE